ncbi:MAG: hypothetical protein U5Q44_00355 [Dehalococcoidia bacterium]|nr:hypothetical protein [Dehalococcoidia bacterium]
MKQSGVVDSSATAPMTRPAGRRPAGTARTSADALVVACRDLELLLLAVEGGEHAIAGGVTDDDHLATEEAAQQGTGVVGRQRGCIGAVLGAMAVEDIDLPVIDQVDALGVVRGNKAELVEGDVHQGIELQGGREPVGSGQDQLEVLGALLGLVVRGRLQLGRRRRRPVPPSLRGRRGRPARARGRAPSRRKGRRRALPAGEPRRRDRHVRDVHGFERGVQGREGGVFEAASGRAQLAATTGFGTLEIAGARADAARWRSVFGQAFQVIRGQASLDRAPEVAGPRIADDDGTADCARGFDDLARDGVEGFLDAPGQVEVGDDAGERGVLACTASAVVSSKRRALSMPMAAKLANAGARSCARLSPKKPGTLLSTGRGTRRWIPGTCNGTPVARPGVVDAGHGRAANAIAEGTGIGRVARLWWMVTSSARRRGGPRIPPAKPPRGAARR